MLAWSSAGFGEGTGTFASPTSSFAPSGQNIAFCRMCWCATRILLDFLLDLARRRSSAPHEHSHRLLPASAALADADPAGADPADADARGAPKTAL